MLTDLDWLNEIKQHDLDVYAKILPAEHRLLDALELIPWNDFLPELESYYCPDRGQPAKYILVMLKLEYLRHQYRLSDREVIARSQTDLLFRWFLQLPLHASLPVPSLLSIFRGRLGVEGFQKIFDRLVAIARQENLIRDRLRLKDATHIIANIAVPTTLGLLAQLRDQMIAAIALVDAEAAIGFRIDIDRMRKDTQDAAVEVRLQGRISLVQDLLGWIVQYQSDQHQAARGRDLLSESVPSRAMKELCRVRSLAEKILDDQAHPGQGDRTISVYDPEARCGKHGKWYDGYVVDVMMDADSELITAVQVLYAGGDEAQDAVTLVRQEQAAHGNQIENFSIDGAGFNGSMLRQLEAPEGAAVKVFTPPDKACETGVYPPGAFELSEDLEYVTCPAGERSHSKSPAKVGSTIYRFRSTQCKTCELLSRCKSTHGSRAWGRSVSKNQYEAEYQRARERSTTPEYAAIRSEHPRIERKLGELVNRHDLRRTRYRGKNNVHVEAVMTTFAANVKRMTKLLVERVRASASPTAVEIA